MLASTTGLTGSLIFYDYVPGKQVGIFFLQTSLENIACEVLLVFFV